jgi:hypothetical protein
MRDLPPLILEFRQNMIPQDEAALEEGRAGLQQQPDTAPVTPSFNSTPTKLSFRLSQSSGKISWTFEIHRVLIDLL